MSPASVRKAISLDGSDTVASFAEMLSSASLLSEDGFRSTLEERLAEAAGGILIGRPYREIHREFTDDAIFFDEAGGMRSTFFGPNAISPAASIRCSLVPLASVQLTAVTGVEADRARLRTRFYERRSYHSKTDAASRATAPPGWLARRGLKDWEIISIIANAIANLGQPVEDDKPDVEAERRLRAAHELQENPKTALETDCISDTHRRVFLIAHLISWGLDVPIPNIEKMASATFLTERCGMGGDDVDHADIFGWILSPVAS